MRVVRRAVFQRTEVGVSDERKATRRRVPACLVVCALAVVLTPGAQARTVAAFTADSAEQRAPTPIPGDKYPVSSPDGRKIAFTSARDGYNAIYVMNADGSEQRRLTRNKWADGFPAWSPDGHRIAFTSTRDGNAEIYVMSADGSDQRRLTRNPADDGVGYLGWSSSAWSPDGREIAFASQRDGNDEIYVMNADGSGVRRLTNDPE